MKKKNYSELLIGLVSVLVLFTAIGVSAQSQSSKASLSNALNADGSIKPDISGSFDPSGFKLTQGPKGEPRFVAADRKTEGGCSDGWDTTFTTNGANNDVYVLVSDGAGNIYAGGDFTSMQGVPAGGIAKWDGTTWSALGSGVSGTVNAIAISGSDVYVGGGFSQAGGIAAKNVAKWNGTSWSAMSSGLGGGTHDVRSLAFFGGDLYAGGGFNVADGSPASGVARWTGSVWTNVGPFGPSANALVVKDGILYAAGGGGVMKWDGTSWTILGSLEGSISDIAFKGTELWAVGSARNAGDPTYMNVLKWNGTTWVYVAYFHNELVSAVAVSGSDLYFGGTFTRSGGQFITDGIVKFDGTNYTALGTGTTGGSHRVNDILVDGTKMYVGGDFTTAGSVGARNIAMLTSGTTWAGFSGTGLDDRPLTMTPLGSDLYLGGSFLTAGPATVNRIAKWNGSTFSALGSGMVTPFGTASVGTVAVSGNKVYAGGSFSTAGGITVNHIAMWNGSAWSALGSGVSGGTVSAIAVASSGVYVGGSFTTAGGITVNRIAKWNGSAWSALGSGLDGPVNLIKVVGPDIYVAGSFENAGGAPAHRIAKWNGTSWVGLGSGVLWTTPHTIAVSGSDLYVASETTAVDSDTYISKYDGTTWTPLGAGMGGRGVRTLAVLGTDVYISGGFSSIGGVTVNRIAKWNGSTWSALGGGLPGGFGSNNVKIAAAGSDLIATGDFTTAAGAPANYVAKWNGTAWSTLGAGLDAPAETIVPVGGDVYFGGNFTVAGCNLSPYFARWRQTVWTASTSTDWHTAANWGGSSVPGGNAGVTISANDAAITSADVTLSSLIVMNTRTLTIGAGRTLTVDGNLDLRDGFVTGPGTLVVKGDLNVNGGSVSNVASLTVDRHMTLNGGNISGPGTVTVKGDLNAGGNISNVTSLTVERNLVLSGDISGTGAITVQNDLIINSGTISNAPSLTITRSLALNGGNISGTGMVTVVSCSVTALTGGSTTSFIASPLTRCVNSSGIFRFPVGTGSVYSPAELANVAGSANFTVEAHAGPYGTASGLSANRLQRWWSTTNGGITKADLTFNYANADIVGTEDYYRVFSISGGAAVRVPTAFQPTANRATISGITTFSDYTMAEGDSFIQMMNGRLIARGRGADNVEITMTDQFGNIYRTKTNQMGFFRFDNMPTIRTYTFAFKSKRYQLATRPVMFDGDPGFTVIGP